MAACPDSDAAAAKATVGGGAVAFLPWGGGGGLFALPEWCAWSGNTRGSVESAVRGFCFQSHPERESYIQPLPFFPLPRFTRPLPSFLHLGAEGGGNGVTPAVLHSPQAMGARIRLPDLAIKIQDAS